MDHSVVLLFLPQKRHNWFNFRNLGLFYPDLTSSTVYYLFEILPEGMSLTSIAKKMLFSCHTLSCFFIDISLKLLLLTEAQQAPKSKSLFHADTTCIKLSNVQCPISVTQLNVGVVFVGSCDFGCDTPVYALRGYDCYFTYWLLFSVGFFRIVNLMRDGVAGQCLL